MKRVKREAGISAGLSLQGLPPHAYLEIVRYFDDPPTVVAFLNVLAIPRVRGPLEPLWQLLRQEEPTSHVYFWPTLHLRPGSNSNDTVSLFESIVGIYPHVIVRRNFDPAWLRQHLPADTTIEWQGIPDSPDQIGGMQLTDWFAQWPPLRIQSLVMTYQNIDRLIPVLPTLPHLVKLTLDFSWCTSIGPLLAWLHVSNILELHLQALNERRNSAQYTPEMLQQFCHWLETRPVRRLKLVSCQWESDNNSTHEFFRAMLSCPTLETLVINECRLPIQLVAPTQFPLKLRNLDMGDCSVQAQGLKDVSLALVGSNVETLGLRGCEYYNHGLMYLFAAIEHSKVTYLDLSKCNIGSHNIAHLTPFFDQENCVETLVLNGNPIDDIGAHQFAHALRRNTCLRHLHVSGCELGLDGIVSLLTIPSMRARPLKSIRVGWTTSMSADDVTLVKSIAQKMNVELAIGLQPPPYFDGKYVPNETDAAAI
ncbi:Aste57867_9171 [Aphanomyces stellatus]|uniref:Aste57867_9171 protein n=1 Tax=Aphanomyces stellatus TaxID=120398 RepID=A0A485KMA0_9STRA|nr:hypothetical protein As57867_009135 [Aphanomyces stellatus]VFT86055.1 Aste57867_9171 [Aphanomyces stellatus]